MSPLAPSKLHFSKEGDLLVQALAHRRGEYRGGRFVVAWAVAALEQGLDAPSLATLAGLDPEDAFEIDRCFKNALEELGRVPSGEADPLWTYARMVASRTAEGNLPWSPALEELVSLFYASNYDSRLVRFSYLSDDLDRLAEDDEPLFYHSLRRFDAAEVVRAEARSFVRSLDPPLGVLESALGERFELEEGEDFELKLGPGLDDAGLSELQDRLPGPIPESIEDLLRHCRSFDFLLVDSVHLAGKLPFEHAELFPHGLPIVGDGLGNFWVVDVQPDGAWGPIFYACHDPPVVVVQAPDLSVFLEELLRLGRLELPSQVRHVAEHQAHFIWRSNPGLLAVTDARRSSDDELRRFAMELSHDFEIADLRRCEIGTGFSWGRAGFETGLRRFGSSLLFAVEKKKPLWRRLIRR